MSDGMAVGRSKDKLYFYRCIIVADLNLGFARVIKEAMLIFVVPAHYPRWVVVISVLG